MTVLTILMGCASIPVNQVVGKYSGSALMLYKELEVKEDNTFRFYVEGDLFAHGIVTKGQFIMRGRRLILEPDSGYIEKKMVFHLNDSCLYVKKNLKETKICKVISAPNTR